MAKIKLFSGMDFSGKSTIIKNIDAAMPGVFKVQKKAAIIQVYRPHRAHHVIHYAGLGMDKARGILINLDAGF